ncbi:WhiB family transcriptional regulator [Nocardiopsis synnemataformans]|uniref:WhiB family transcriptional regulator n=1 Tax=Nocardiopsis synnemataformans TaxID=61305 RepID=UPI003EB8F633
MNAVAVQARWQWQDGAVCAGLDPARRELFFGPQEETRDEQADREEQAIALCRQCPVIAACLEHALNRAELHGVWGGSGEDERARIRRRRQRQAKAARDREQGIPGPGQVRTLGDARILQGLAVGGRGLPVVRAWTRISLSTLEAVRSGARPFWPAAHSVKLRGAVPQILDDPPMRFLPVSAAALAQGWVGLPAWEGLDIDDPATQPLLPAA